MKIKRQKPFSVKSNSATFQLTIFDHDVRRVLRLLLQNIFRNIGDDILPIFTRENLIKAIACESGLKKQIIGQWGYEVAKRQGWIIEKDEEHVTLSIELLKYGQGVTSYKNMELIQRAQKSTRK